jgi:hypothetical protein
VLPARERRAPKPDPLGSSFPSGKQSAATGHWRL